MISLSFVFHSVWVLCENLARQRRNKLWEFPTSIWKWSFSSNSRHYADFFFHWKKTVDQQKKSGLMLNIASSGPLVTPSLHFGKVPLGNFPTFAFVDVLGFRVISQGFKESQLSVDSPLGNSIKRFDIEKHQTLKCVKHRKYPGKKHLKISKK